MAEAIIKPFGNFILTSGSSRAWDYPSNAYDNNTESYAEGSDSRQTFFKVKIPYDEVLDIKLRLRYADPAPYKNNNCNFWIGYGNESSVTRIGDKLLVQPARDKQIYEDTFSLGLSASNIASVVAHKDNLVIGAKATSGYFFKVYDMALVVSYVPTSSIYVGNTQASAVYVGGTKAKAVYVGTTKVL